MDLPKIGGDKGINREELMKTYQQGIQTAVATGMLEKMTRQCFETCVTKPGATLDNYEQKCIALCMDRFIDAREIVEREFRSRLQQETGFQ